MPFSVYNEKRRDGRNHHQSGEKIIKRRPATRVKVMAYDIELWSAKVKVAIIMIKKAWCALVHKAAFPRDPQVSYSKRVELQKSES